MVYIGNITIYVSRNPVPKPFLSRSSNYKTENKTAVTLDDKFDDLGTAFTGLVDKGLVAEVKIVWF